MEEQNPSIIEALEKFLQNFETTILPEDGKGALKYLTMGEPELNVLSAEQCGEAAVMLTSLSYNVHRASNKEKTKANYLNKMLMKNIASRMGQYQYRTTEERMALAIAEDDYAIKIQKELVVIQAKIDRIEYLSIKFDNSAQMFNNLQSTKRKMQ